MEKWDQRYTARGNKFLQLARQTNSFSVFHIEVAVAAMHVSRTPAPDWQQISPLYDAFLKLSPTLGRTIGAAIAKYYSGDNTAALELLEN